VHNIIIATRNCIPCFLVLYRRDFNQYSCIPKCAHFHGLFILATTPLTTNSP